MRFGEMPYLCNRIRNSTLVLDKLFLFSEYRKGDVNRVCGCSFLAAE